LQQQAPPPPFPTDNAPGPRHHNAPAAPPAAPNQPNLPGNDDYGDGYDDDGAIDDIPF
jgi:hypothetical protein